MNSPTLDYHNLLVDLKNNGYESLNNRTGKTTTFLLNKSLTYDRLPYPATKHVAMKSSVAEMLGYLKGYDSAEQFRKLGTKTWDANANAPAWQNREINTEGKDYMGRVYGVQGRDWRIPSEFVEDTNSVDQLAKILKNLKAGIDDRGEILTFWNPGEIHKGCLRACMHTHHFSLTPSASNASDGELDTLHLTSYQRSADIPLGMPFNMLQTWFLLSFVAWLTDKKVGKVTHNIVNYHIYEDQWEGVEEQIGRIGEGMALDVRNEGKDFCFEGLAALFPERDSLDTMLEIVDFVTLKDIGFPVVEHMSKIDFPFSV